MPKTFEPITKLTVSSAGTVWDLQNIPQTYSDLRLIVAGYATTSGFQGIRINNLSTNIYSSGGFYTSGSGVSNNNYQTSDNIVYAASGGWNASYPVAAIIDIFDYTNTSYHKTGWLTYAQKNPSTTQALEQRVISIGTTGAITRIQQASGVVTFAVGSEISLWGILRA